MTSSEHRALRAMVGQGAWNGRLGNPELSFEVPRLSGYLAAPTIRQMKEANTMIRKARRQCQTKVIFSNKVNMRKCIVVGVAECGRQCV